LPPPVDLRAGGKAPLPDCTIFSSSFEQLGNFENLFGPRTHPIVFRQVQPSNSARRIKQKLRGPCDVVTILSGACVNQIVAPNHFGIRIGKKRERVTSLLRKIARHLWTVDTDRNRPNSGLVELL
jgi:hypothetical protein